MLTEINLYLLVSSASSIGDFEYSVEVEYQDLKINIVPKGNETWNRGTWMLLI